MQDINSYLKNNLKTNNQEFYRCPLHYVMFIIRVNITGLIFFFEAVIKSHIITMLCLGICSVSPLNTNTLF